MPIEIKITADTADQARLEMERFLNPLLEVKDRRAANGAEAIAALQNALASRSLPPETVTVAADEPAPTPGEKPAAKKPKPKKAEAPEPEPAAEAPQVDEPEPTEPAGAALTLDDVRNALGRYVSAYGMAAAQEDGPKVITLLFGEGKVKVSDVPETQEALRKAVDGVLELLAKNPYKRTPVAKAAA